MWSVCLPRVGQSLLSARRRKMCKGLGFSTGFVAFCAFVSAPVLSFLFRDLTVSLLPQVSCFGILHMLNKIVYVNQDMAMHSDYRLEAPIGGDSNRCQRTFIVDSAGSAHLTWMELFYMKWTLVLTILYSFVVMILIRAQYLSHFDINFITSNAVSTYCRHTRTCYPLHLLHR